MCRDRRTSRTTPHKVAKVGQTHTLRAELSSLGGQVSQVQEGRRVCQVQGSSGPEAQALQKRALLARVSWKGKRWQEGGQQVAGGPR